MTRAAARSSGVLVVDKAAGMTSHDVVALGRRRLGLRRVGHAGTLDPAATGVLPILLGEATKLMPYLAEQDKAYVVTIRLGVTTDTQDLQGRILAERPVPPLTPETVARAARGFVGRIRQVPPMYSAVRHEGRRLYELAREGREVHHHVGLAQRLHRPRDVGLPADVAFDQGHLPRAQYALEVRPFHPGGVVRVEVVEHHDPIAPGDERFHEVRADEPGPTRDENVHRLTSAARRTGSICSAARANSAHRRRHSSNMSNAQSRLR